jgi:hypothetical protein
MAVLQQPVVNGNVFAELIGDDLAPAGTYVATVIDVRDEFGVQRQKFQSTEIEMVDLTTFLFGFRDAQGYEHRVASRRMKISGNEKAALFAFLKCLLGRAPQYGWDYLAVKGAQCLLTVEHVTKRDGTGVFAAIAALSPVPAGFGVQSGGQTGGQSGGQAFAPRPAAVAPVTAGPAAPPYPTRSAAMAPRPLNAPPVGPVAGVRPMAPSVAPVAAAVANDPLPF